MRLVPPSREPVALAAALGAGVLVGFAPIPELAGRVLGKPGLGIAFTINVLLPLVTVIIAVAFPRMRTAVIAGVLVVLGFVLARLLIGEMRPWRWNGAFLRQHTHPIEVAAMVGCAVIGAVAAAVAMSFRRVGSTPHEPSCRHCGHALAASLDAERPASCPECGMPTEVSRPSRRST